MPTIDSIQTNIDLAVTPGFRNRLIARGQARSIIWRDGILPPDAPVFSENLSYDLYSYAYSLLEHGLRLRELEGDPHYSRLAFEQAGIAFESVIANGQTGDSNRSFHFVMAAAAYHLAHLSARAYSLLATIANSDNFSLIELCLSCLMRRDFNTMRTIVMDFKLRENGSDSKITAKIEEYWNNRDSETNTDPSSYLFDGLDLALTDHFLGAISSYLLALERGESALKDVAIADLYESTTICSELNLVPQWWVHRIARHLISDLWSSTFHHRLPIEPTDGQSNDEWRSMRERFIATLFCRKRTEIDFWPSQIEAAARSLDQRDDLVVSLPTSAGKTRISELCILRALSCGRRVVFVTPLRALSAQTELSLRRTFGKLGKTVSALYGSIGVSDFEEDTIKSQDIVVSTPEKLDFALRNDPSLLDDVGLLVFDEGHMIGPNEREVRYEVQIQRLLRRDDAAKRRIVCLSAILPDGTQLEDFVNWLRKDKDGELVKSEWRPTRLRFGEVVWNGRDARLDLRVDQENPFVPRFLSGFVPPNGKRKNIFPNDLGELCLATAWRLVDDGQSVLIFCPVRAHVESFANRILDLHKRGALQTLLQLDEEILNNALVLGAEWLGYGHPVLECLKLGVAIHHGSLPKAFRKEVEFLLRQGVLKVTISSPTLAQGLNLSATSVIFHSLYRQRKRIDASEFKNVIGRAGRAFVDVEGLVLYPIFDTPRKRKNEWEELINDLGSHDMESGLVQLVIVLMNRIHKKTNANLSELTEYIANSAEAWDFPEVRGESSEDRQIALDEWHRDLAILDTAILSLVGEYDVPESLLESTLDNILQSSLWNRRLLRRREKAQLALRQALLSRSQFIWNRSTAIKRKGYFLAGIGLETGRALDEVSTMSNYLLVVANHNLLNGLVEDAIDSIIKLAELVFKIEPFSPNKLPSNWKGIVRSWLLGEKLTEVANGHESEILQFIEDGLVYRLPWAMEAIRVKGIANNDIVDEDTGLLLEHCDLSLAVPAIETGTCLRSASILIQAGFSSRLAAIKAVKDTEAVFANNLELQLWLASDLVTNLSDLSDWPTQETAALWKNFLKDYVGSDKTTWSEQRFEGEVNWQDKSPQVGTPIRLENFENVPVVLSHNGSIIGEGLFPLNPNRQGLLRATVTDGEMIDINYLGPEDLWLVQDQKLSI